MKGWRTLGPAWFAGIAAMHVTAVAHATAPTIFGFGARDVAMAQSDVADAAPVAAAYVNPAAAASPGTRIAAGYRHAFSQLEIDGRDAEVRDIAGTELAMQIGGRLGDRTAWGLGLDLYLPNRSLARIAFRPGTEPTYVRFEPASHRTTADAVVAFRHGWLSLGVGGSLLVSAEGQIDFLLGQDGDGTYADGQSDVSLPYEVAPVAGVSADFGVASLAFRYRGAQSIDLDLRTNATVDVQGNPLNGLTRVSVQGASGYVPATYDVGARWSLSHGFRVTSALQLARWSEAPSPAARLGMDVDLGLSPGQREALFVRPGFRDTLSPRVGAELQPGGLTDPWVLRMGYAFVPSPVADPDGFASPVDASTHTVSFGTGWDFGAVWGVDLRADFAGQLVQLQERSFDKQQDTIPFARYRASGRLWLGCLSLEGTWR